MCLSKGTERERDSETEMCEEMKGITWVGGEKLQKVRSQNRRSESRYGEILADVWYTKQT